MIAPDVRVGLVGCGRLAERGYLPAAARARGVRITAVADPDGPRRRALAAWATTGELTVSHHADAAELLGAADVDALVLATPASHHVGDAEVAVGAGVPVLVEKPPAPDVAGAVRLAALGPLVHVGFNRRFDPAVARLRHAAPSSHPLALHLELRYRRASWAAHVVRDEVLLDLAPHLVDLARWLSRRQVTSVAATHLSPQRAELSLDLDGTSATVLVAADHLHRERVEVRSGGRVLARHRTGGPAAAVTGRASALLARARGAEVVHPLVASLAAQLEALAAAVRGAPAGALATADDGVAVMGAIDAARVSHASGGEPVPLTDLLEHPPC